MELCYGQIVKNVIPSGLLPNLGVIFSNGMFISLESCCIVRLIVIIIKQIMYLDFECIKKDEKDMESLIQLLALV